MTCQDCVHYEACKGNGVLIGLADYCVHYQDITKFIELPFQIGDNVWILPKYGERKLPYKCQITNLMISQNKKKVFTQKYRAMALENGKTVDRAFDFSFNEIGVSVFDNEIEAVDTMRNLLYSRGKYE